MARPQKTATLTAEQIEQLAAVGCTDTEIATLAGISEGTLKRSFDPLLKKGRSDLRSNLRTAQVRKALGVIVQQEDKDGETIIYQTPPDNTMLIWLGKQYLGQRDKAETQHSGSADNPMTIRVVRDAND
jgi:DNA-binding CsgD family transcriptional regulator